MKFTHTLYTYTHIYICINHHSYQNIKLFQLPTDVLPYSFFSQLVTSPFTPFSSFQSLGCVQLFATPWTAARQASMSITNSWSLLKLMSIESVMPFNHLILCHPLLLLPSIFSSTGVFSNELVFHIRWPKYWCFSISSSKDYSGLISSIIVWFDILGVQGSLKSLLQHQSSKE